VSPCWITVGGVSETPVQNGLRPTIRASLAYICVKFGCLTHSILASVMNSGPNGLSLRTLICRALSTRRALWSVTSAQSGVGVGVFVSVGGGVKVWVGVYVGVGV